MLNINRCLILAFRFERLSSGYFNSLRTFGRDWAFRVCASCRTSRRAAVCTIYLSRRRENHWLRSFSFSLLCSISVLHEQVIKPRASPDCPNEFDQSPYGGLPDGSMTLLRDCCALPHDETTHVCRLSDRDVHVDSESTTCFQLLVKISRGWYHPKYFFISLQLGD